MGWRRYYLSYLCTVNSILSVNEVRKSLPSFLLEKLILWESSRFLFSRIMWVLSLWFSQTLNNQCLSDLTMRPLHACVVLLWAMLPIERFVTNVWLHCTMQLYLLYILLQISIWDSFWSFNEMPINKEEVTLKFFSTLILIPKRDFYPKINCFNQLSEILLHNFLTLFHFKRAWISFNILYI